MHLKSVDLSIADSHDVLMSESGLGYFSHRDPRNSVLHAPILNRQAEVERCDATELPSSQLLTPINATLDESDRSSPVRALLSGCPSDPDDGGHTLSGTDAAKRPVTGGNCSAN